MPANFPSSPNVGDRHTIADKTWEYTGNVWDLVVSTNTLQFSGEDSTVITVNLTANEELRLVGDGSNITTAGSAGDSSNSTLQISLSKNIDVNTISSSDSTSVTVNDGLIVAGSLSFQGGASVSTIVDEENMASNSATALATQQSIKAYVDSQITSSNTLTIGDDASTQISINLDENVDFKGGNSITTAATGDTVTFALDKAIDINTISSSDSAMIEVQDSMRVTGSLVTNTISSDDSTALTINDSLIVANSLSFQGGVSVNNILDEDNMASNSATSLATQQSIKAYVDTETGNVASDTMTLTNKTFDVEGTGNSISNIDVADLKAGVLDTDISSVSGSDDTLASAKAIKTYVDAQTSSIVTTIGISDSASTRSTLTLGTNDLEFRSGDSITGTVSGTGVRFDLNETISVDTITAGDSSAITISSPTVLNSTLKFNTDGTVAVSSIKDEDNMASNSATALATQQSIKAYVDSVSG